MRFRTTILRNGKTATGIEVPEVVLAAVGHGKRPPVRVMINGHTFRSTIAVMGGRSLVGLSAENRVAAGVAGGDEVDVDIEFDSKPREINVPPDLQGALDQDAVALQFFQQLSYSQQQWYVLGVEQAKKPETRTRRVEKAVAALHDGRKQG